MKKIILSVTALMIGAIGLAQTNTSTVEQKGTLNSVQVFGENSMMKDAKINQKSDYKSIVVKNYTK